MSFDLRHVFRREKKYKMDEAAANDALQNIFAACNRKPNITPFDEIIRTSRPDNRATTACIWLCIAALAATLLSPLTFTQTELKDNYIAGEYLYLDCSGKKLVPEECTMVDVYGNVYSYHHFNYESNTICFPKPTGDANITLVFTNDKQIHLGYTIK